MAAAILHWPKEFRLCCTGIALRFGCVSGIMFRILAARGNEFVLRFQHFGNYAGRRLPGCGDRVAGLEHRRIRADAVNCSGYRTLKDMVEISGGVQSRDGMRTLLAQAVRIQER